MAKRKVVNIYRVKQDINGVPPTGVSDDNYEKLNVLGNVLNLKNIPPWYTQYADSEGNFIEYEDPTNWYKKMYGIDTSWELMFNTDSVYFRTEGSKSNSSRSSGVQPYGMKPLNGSFAMRANNSGPVGGLGSEDGIVSTIDPYNYGLNASLVTSGNIPRRVTIDTSNQMRSYSDDIVVSNRLIRVYHLLSINGVNVSDIMR